MEQIYRESYNVNHIFVLSQLGKIMHKAGMKILGFNALLITKMRNHYYEHSYWNWRYSFII